MFKIKTMLLTIVTGIISLFLLSNSASAADVIWYHLVRSHSLVTLEKALSSGKITHVLISNLHKNDAPYDSGAVKGAIALAKKYDAKVILCRNLWPAYKMGDFQQKAFLNKAYYIAQIRELREDALLLGADYIAFDTEPCANSLTKEALAGSRNLTITGSKLLEAALTVAVAKEGKVDYILPAGSNNSNKAYDILARLGEKAISKDTFYNNPKIINNIEYHYDVFGAYVSVSADNPGYPNQPYFTLEQVLVQPQLFAGKDALLLYTDGKKSYDTAVSLYESGLNIVRPTVNTTPSISINPVGSSKTIATGQTLTFAVSASDADGDPLTYSVNPLPPGASIEWGQIFTWTPNVKGAYNITFIVTDCKGAKDSRPVTIIVM